MSELDASIPDLWQHQQARDLGIEAPEQYDFWELYSKILMALAQITRRTAEKIGKAKDPNYKFRCNRITVK